MRPTVEALTLAGSRSIGFRVEGREQIYRLVERVLAAQHYRRLGKRQKGIVRRFLARLSGLSRAQLPRAYPFNCLRWVSVSVTHGAVRISSSYQMKTLRTTYK